MHCDCNAINIDILFVSQIISTFLLACGSSYCFMLLNFMQRNK